MTTPTRLEPRTPLERAWQEPRCAYRDRTPRRGDPIGSDRDPAAVALIIYDPRTDRECTIHVCAAHRPTAVGRWEDPDGDALMVREIRPLTR